jgi:hypothetical protein
VRTLTNTWGADLETLEEAMEGDKPTALMCTVLAIDYTSFCYRVCSVCERTLPDNPTSFCKFCNFNAFNSVSTGSKRLFRVLVSNPAPPPEKNSCLFLEKIWGKISVGRNGGLWNWEWGNGLFIFPFLISGFC